MDDLPVFPDFPEFLLCEPTGISVSRAQPKQCHVIHKPNARIIRVQRKLPTPRTSPVPRTSPSFGDGWYDNLPIIPGPVSFSDMVDDEIMDCFVSPKKLFRERINSLTMEDCIEETTPTDNRYK
ncbi:hypothetical protein ACF0H5_013123 [Mactra antiquata]